MTFHSLGCEACLRECCSVQIASALFKYLLRASRIYLCHILLIKKQLSSVSLQSFFSLKLEAALRIILTVLLGFSSSVRSLQKQRCTNDKRNFCERGNNIVWIWICICVPRKQGVGKISLFVTKKKFLPEIFLVVCLCSETTWGILSSVVTIFMKKKPLCSYRFLKKLLLCSVPLTRSGRLPL